MASVLIVDDQLVARQLFEMLLRDSENYRVADSLASAEGAVAWCRVNPVDLILMDVVMLNGRNGLEAAKEIRKYRPDVRIVAVTSMPEESFLERAREAGIDSFWYKEIQERPLLEVLDRTMAGEHVYPDTSPEIMLGNCLSIEITPKEMEVLRELTTGATDQEIAERLKVSAATVRFHVKNLLSKTGFRSRTQLAVRARTRGLVIGGETYQL